MNKRKNITVFSLKGGQGKTSIATTLALTLGYMPITNDIYSPIDEVFPRGRFLKLKPDQAIPPASEIKDGGILFDMGGYLDARVYDAAKMSGLVIIPIAGEDKLNIKGMLSTIGEISKINKNIIIILNKMSKENRMAMRKGFENTQYSYPVFEIKESKSLQLVMEEKKSLREIVEEGGLRRYMYKEVSDQFDKIILYIEELFSR